MGREQFHIKFFKGKNSSYLRLVFLGALQKLTDFNHLCSFLPVADTLLVELPTVSFNELDEKLQAYVNAYPLRHIEVIGVSMGARWAVHWAIRYLPARLYLVAPEGMPSSLFYEMMTSPLARFFWFFWQYMPALSSQLRPFFRKRIGVDIPIRTEEVKLLYKQWLAARCLRVSSREVLCLQDISVFLYVSEHDMLVNTHQTLRLWSCHHQLVVSKNRLTHSRLVWKTLKQLI